MPPGRRGRALAALLELLGHGTEQWQPPLRNCLGLGSAGGPRTAWAAWARARGAAAGTARQRCGARASPSWGLLRSRISWRPAHRLGGVGGRSRRCCRNSAATVRCSSSDSRPPATSERSIAAAPAQQGRRCSWQGRVLPGQHAGAANLTGEAAAFGASLPSSAWCARRWWHEWSSVLDNPGSPNHPVHDSLNGYAVPESDACMTRA